MSGFKKQLKLIDILKRQKVCGKTRDAFSILAESLVWSVLCKDITLLFLFISNNFRHCHNIMRCYYCCFIQCDEWLSHCFNDKYFISLELSPLHTREDNTSLSKSEYVTVMLLDHCRCTLKQLRCSHSQKRSLSRLQNGVTEQVIVCGYV